MNIDFSFPFFAKGRENLITFPKHKEINKDNSLQHQSSSSSKWNENVALLVVGVEGQDLFTQSDTFSIHLFIALLLHFKRPYCMTLFSIERFSKTYYKLGSCGYIDCTRMLEGNQMALDL